MMLNTEPLDLSDFILESKARKRDDTWIVEIGKGLSKESYYISSANSEYEAKEIAYLHYMDRI